MSETAARALRLTESLYAAALDDAQWWRFARELSDALGGAAVAIALRLPGAGVGPRYYEAGLHPGRGRVFSRHYARGLPWGSFAQPAFRNRFCHGREVLPDARVAETAFYREWMRPHGLAAEGPLAHTIAADGARALAGLAAFRREGGRPFGAADRELCDRLVPHLACAYRLLRRREEVQGRRDALAQVIDRLPTGVVVFDRAGRPVRVNRSAQRLAALGDGFRLDAGGAHAAQPREDAALRQLLAEAVASGSRSGCGRPGVMTISRASERPAFGAVATPLRSPPYPEDSSDPVAVLFVTDIDAGQPSAVETLRTLYRLTHAEAVLAQRLGAGLTLEEIAAERRVSRHTLRSHLKAVFTKTGTRRQAELVRLVLRVGSIEEPAEPADG